MSYCEGDGDDVRMDFTGVSDKELLVLLLREQAAALEAGRVVEEIALELERRGAVR